MTGFGVVQPSPENPIWKRILARQKETIEQEGSSAYSTKNLGGSHSSEGAPRTRSQSLPPPAPRHRVTFRFVDSAEEDRLWSELKERTAASTPSEDSEDWDPRPRPESSLRRARSSASPVRGWDWPDLEVSSRLGNMCKGFEHAGRGRWAGGHTTRTYFVPRFDSW